MAQYKVPQDVEADDKLLGPFNFRQFVYLMVAGGLIALTVGLFQIFPVLAIIPIPFIIFFGVMALPLRRDQPMETYLAAIVSYYLKPKTRIWRSGQRDFTITIMAPKVVENEDRKRTITGEEATHRLSFLADIVDTEGQAIKGGVYNHASAELAQEATRTMDMFEQANNYGMAIKKEEDRRHQEMVQAMREKIATNDAMMASNLTGQKVDTGPNYGSAAVVAPMSPAANTVAQTSTAARPMVQQNTQAHQDRVAAMRAQITQTAAEMAPRPEAGANPATLATPTLPRNLGGVANSARVVSGPNVPTVVTNGTNAAPAASGASVSGVNTVAAVNPSMVALANNSSYSVATIEKEANRIKERDKGEVFISLH